MKNTLLFRNLSRLLFVTIFCMGWNVSLGQFSIAGTGAGNTYTQNFNAFAGTAGTLPTNWAIAGNVSTYNATTQLITAGTTVYTSVNGNNWYAARPNSASSDNAIVIKHSTSGSSTLTFSVKNDTGSTINGFVIGWNSEQYSTANRPTTLNFNYRLGTDAFGTTGLTGTTLTTGTTGADAVVAANAVITNTRSITITGISLAASATADFRFTIANAGSSGSNVHIGIDDFTLYATAPTLTPVTLSSALNTTYGTASSPGVSFTASGTNLSTTITATPQTGYQVSVTNATSGFTSSAISGIANSTTVWVRLSATATASTSAYNSATAVVLSGGGASSTANVTTLSSGNSVSPLAITTTGATAANKIYDGNTTATISGATAVGTVNGDAITISGNGTFSDKNFGTAKSITSALVHSGTNASSYTLTQPTGLTANIDKKALTISSAAAQNKVFDNNANAVITGTLSGIIGVEDVTLIGTGTFATSAVGNGIAVTSTSTLGGTDAGNYTLTQPTGLTANITAVALLPQTITFTLASPVVYGVAPITLTEFASSGLPITYVSSNPSVADVVGNILTVYSNGSTTITASQAGNTIYDPAPNVIQNLVVNQKTLTVASAAGVNKIYDRTNAATFTGTLTGIVGLDDVILNATGTFGQVGFGTGLAITSTATLSGTTASKYVLTQPTGLTATIAKKELTITGATAQNKAFDNNTTATITGGTLTGVISPDVVTLTQSGTFATSAVGNAIAVTSTSTIGGADSGNYTLTQPTGLSANITPAVPVALLQWNTFGNAGTETTELSSFNHANVTAANLTQGTITAGGGANRFGGSGWLNTGESNPSTLANAVAGNDYIQFVVTPASTFSFTPTSFVFSWDRSNTGPSSVTLRSSADNYTANLGTVTGLAASITNNNTITISGLTDLTSATTFRLYGYGATNTGGSGGFDVSTNVVNVQLNGTTASISDPNLIISIPSGPTTFTSVCANSDSSAVTYRITNTGTITATNVQVAVTGADAADFTISGFTQGATIAPSGTADYTITFDPSTAGVKNATVNVTSATNGSNAPTTSVTGTGIATITQAATTNAPTVVGGLTATLSGDYTLGVCPGSTTRGFVYSEDSLNGDPLVGGLNVTTTSVSAAAGNFTLPVTGLSYATLYNYKAYIFDGTTYTYGSNVQFTTSAAPPANDTCVGAISLTINDPAQAGTFVGSTIDYGASRDVWYKFTPICSGTHTINVTFPGNDSEDINFEVYATTCPTSIAGRLTLIDENSVSTPIANSNNFDYELANLATATAGVTYFIRLIDISDAASTFEITVTTTASPSIALANTGTPVAGNIAAGTNDAVLYGFSLTPTACTSSFTFTGANIATSGDADSSDLSNFRLIIDANNNGIADPAEISSPIGTVSSLANPLTFSALGQTLTASTSTRYLLIADVLPGATNGRTITASLADTDITASQTVTGTASGNQQTITATSIAIANNTQVTAGSILRGTNDTVVSKAKFTVSGPDASVTQIDFSTTGTYQSTDIAAFKLWRTTSATVLNTAIDTQISTNQPSVSGAGETLSFVDAQSLPAGDYYYWLTVDVDATATPTRTIIINGLTNTSVVSSGTTITGSTSTAGTQTIIAPSLTIADNTQVAAQSILVGSSNNIISKLSLTAATTNSTVSQISFTTSGTYTNSAIATNGFKLYRTTSATVFDTNNQVGASLSSVSGNGETLTFAVSETVVVGTPNYYWLTADVDANATLGNTIIVNGLTTSDVVSSTVGLFKSGSTTTAGTQTIIATAPTLTTASASVDTPFSITLSPDNSDYRNAITSVRIGATSLAFTTSAGSITLDPANPSNTLLRTVGNKTIDITASNYTANQVIQTMVAGTVAKLAIATALVPPTINGNQFATQPVVAYRDKYDNPTTSTETVTAAKLDAGSWTLGGTTSVTPGSTSSTVAFTDLTALSAALVNNAQIRFSLPNVLGSIPVDSATFTIVAPDFISLVNFGTAVTQNFDGFGSSATASFPVGFRTGSTTTFSSGTTATTLAYGTTGTGAITGTSAGGVINWANGVTASATDRALGFLSGGSFSSPRSIMAKFKNTTGSTVNNVTIAFDYEKYRSGSRAFDWTFFQSSDGTTWTAVSSGNQSYAADANNTVISNPPLSTSKNFALSGLTLANGSDIYLRWTYTGNGGSTNGQGLAIDNFSITACPTLNAGTSGTLTVCAGTIPTNSQLFAALGGPKDNGGSWSNVGLVYTYTVNATSPCIGSATATVTVTEQALPAITNITGDVSNNSLCPNATQTLTANGVAGAGATVTWWTATGGTGTNLGSGTTLANAGPGTYFARVTGTCTPVVEATITITSLDLPSVSAANVSGCSGSSITLLGSGTPTGGSGFFTPASPFVGTSSTTYTYTYTAPNGCTVTSAPANITITPQPTWYLDADGDGYYSSTAVQCASPVGSGWSTSAGSGGNDCVDSPSGITDVNPTNVSPASINPGRPEICYNNIDDNCNGLKSENTGPSCPAVPVTVYNPGTITNFANALSCLPYTYAGAATLGYRIEIERFNNGVTTGQLVTLPTQSSRFFFIPTNMRSFTNNGITVTYKIRASAVINGEEVAYALPTITVNSYAVPKVKLTSCPTALSSIGATISANPGFNATDYSFRIRLTSDTTPSPTYYYINNSASRFVNSNSFTNLQLQYGESYQVSVNYRLSNNGNTEESGWGDECTMTTPTIPVVSIASPVCGSQVTSIGAGISAYPATYADRYKFRIRLTSEDPNTATYYTTAELTSRFTNLSAFGTTLAYNTSYSISVQYRLSTSGNPWSNFGAECAITTPFYPTVDITCNPGITSLTQSISFGSYIGFPTYKIRLIELDSNLDPIPSTVQYITRTYTNFTLSMFTTHPPVVGKNYNADVAIILNGIDTEYGRSCTILTVAPLRPGAAIKQTFTATAYPSPFANNFMLDVKSSSSSIVNVKVYDMLGRLIEQKDANIADMATTTIGERYPSGVYNVVVSQEDNVQTVRVVKR